jgi:3-hydroxyacyl-CoA dehydrogenase
MIVNTIAVIGANDVGRAIAAQVALAGYSTILEDVSREMLERATLAIKKSVDEFVERGELTIEARDAAILSIHPENKIEAAIRDADLIIETVPEELEMKLELFTIFDKFAKPGAIFASTTSTLSILDISDVTVYRERCIGLRFSDAAPGIRVIELTRTELTALDVFSACEELARRMKSELRVNWDLAKQSIARATLRAADIPEA